MDLSRSDLHRIIAEEYLKEEGILQELTDQQKQEMLDWIRGKGPRPDWATDDLGTSRYGTAVQTPDESGVDRAADTMPFPADDMPQYDDEGIDDGGAYDPEAEAPELPLDQGSLEDRLMDLIQGMPPEEVSDLFQAVFSKIPGVEMGPPEEEEPETLYSPGAEGRPQVGFKLEDLMTLIREVMEEGHYHDMGGEDEMYDALDPHGFNAMPDAQIVDQAHKDGLEDIIILDGEGDLINREEVLAAMKDV